jgi:hypothetical protein
VSSRALTDRTQLVVEGFPRSGNTFATFALRTAEARAGRHLSVSSHVHTPSAVIAATARRYPTVVVVRRPSATLASLLVAAPHVTPRAAVDEWVHHHREILPYRHRFVVVTFEEVVASSPALTARIEARFGLRLAPLDPSPAAVAEVLAAVDRRHHAVHPGAAHVLPRPDPARGPALARAGESLRSPALRTALDDADRLYEQLARPGPAPGSGQ